MSRKTTSSGPSGDSTLDEIRQDERPRSWPGYAAAVVAVAVATLARLALDPVLGNNYPFVTYFVAIAAVAWAGRTGPATVALALGGLLTFYLFVPPRYTLAPTDPGVLLGMALFLMVAGVIVAMSHAMRVARDRSVRLLAEAGEREDELRSTVDSEAEQRERLRTTLASIGDAVIATDTGGRITSMNAVAEALTGWTTADAAGQPLDAVFNIVNEKSRQPVDNPALRALQAGVIVGLANHTVLIARDGTERPIDDSAAPIRCKDGEVVGCVLVFRDVTDRHREATAQAERLRLVGLRADVGTALAAAQPLEAGLQQCCEAFVRHIDVAFARVWTHDEAAGVLVLRASAGRYTHLDGPHSRVRVGEYKIGRIASTRQPHLTNDVRHDPNVSDHDWAEREGMVAFAGHPLTVEGRLVGVLAVFARRPLTEVVLTDLAPLADQIAQHVSRKRTNDTLRGSEERLRALVTASSDAVYRMNADWTEMGFLRGQEFIADTHEPDRTWLQKYIHPDDQAVVTEVIRQAVRTRTVFELEHRVLRIDGSVGWTFSRAVPLLDAGGEVVEWFGAASDVTTRRGAEERLRASEERYRTLFDSMDEGYCVIEMMYDADDRPSDYRYLIVNPAFVQHTGLTDAVGKTIKEMVPDHDAHWFDTYGRVAATGEPIRFVNEAHAMGGLWFELYAFRVGGPGSRQVAVLFNNITARKRAEETVRASEARNAYLVILADVLRPVSDPAAVQAEASRVLGEHLRANRVAYFEIRGDDYVVGPNYTRGVVSIAGRYPVASFGPDVLAAHREGRTAVEADVDALPARTPDAKAAFAAIQVRSHVSVPLVKDGAFVAGLAVHAAGVREWTPAEVALVVETAERTWAAVERAKVEAALRASEEQRRLALDAADAGAWNIDPATNVMTSDDRFRLIFTGSTAPLAYEQAFAAIHPDDRDRVRDAVAAATRPDDPAPYAEEYRVVHPDGSTRWALAQGRANFVPTSAGRLLASFDGTVTDITARKLIEEDRQRLVTLAENSTDFIAMCDLDYRPVFANRAAMAMVGIDGPEDFYRTPLAEFFFPDDWPRIAGEFLPAVLDRGDGETEVRFRHFRTGAALWMLYRVFALTVAGGRRVGLATVSRDITSRKKLEDDLRRLAADLSDADRRKDEFLATLAHELRNPLAPIRNGLQVIRLSGATGQVEQARSMMDRQVTQLVRLVDDLLDVSRITGGKLELRKERVDLRTVINAALETSRTAVEQAGHELTVAVPDEPLPVDGDPTRLAQVVSNLLNNSAKYTHRGGHVRLAVGRDGGQVVVSVADDGIGIPPAMLGRVFEMFTQVDRTLEKTTGGLGIGLSLVKGLVEMHGGTIEARSEGEGRGSEFVVRLPVAAAEVGKTAGGGPVEAAPSGTRRILVVDDNVDAADSLGQLLELLGNEVRTAHDGEAGVRAAGEFRPAVVLMDIGMPVLNGYEAARRIREQPWGGGMVLVALTGWGQDDDRRKTAEAGFDSHMVKPVEAAALMKFLAGLGASTV